MLSTVCSQAELHKYLSIFLHLKFGFLPRFLEGSVGLYPFTRANEQLFISDMNETMNISLDKVINVYVDG